MGNFQARKFAEIAELLNDGGLFIVSYVNFAIATGKYTGLTVMYRAIDDFRQSLTHHFKIQRFFPTSYNWNHLSLAGDLVKAANMHINVNIPFISRILAVEYFFICSSRYSTESRRKLVSRIRQASLHSHFTSPLAPEMIGGFSGSPWQHRHVPSRFSRRTCCGAVQLPCGVRRIGHHLKPSRLTL